MLERKNIQLSVIVDVVSADLQTTQGSVCVYSVIPLSLFSLLGRRIESSTSYACAYSLEGTATYVLYFVGGRQDFDEHPTISHRLSNLFDHPVNVTSSEAIIDENHFVPATGNCSKRSGYRSNGRWGANAVLRGRDEEVTGI